MIIKVHEVDIENIEGEIEQLTPEQLNNNLIHYSLSFNKLAKDLNVSVTTVRQILYENPLYAKKKNLILPFLRNQLKKEITRLAKLYV